MSRYGAVESKLYTLAAEFDEEQWKAHGAGKGEEYLREVCGLWRPRLKAGMEGYVQLSQVDYDDGCEGVAELSLVERKLHRLGLIWSNVKQVRDGCETIGWLFGDEPSRRWARRKEEGDG